METNNLITIVAMNKEQIPRGMSMEDIKERERIIKEFYNKWGG